MRLLDCAQLVGWDFFFLGFLPVDSAGVSVFAAAAACSSAMSMLHFRFSFGRQGFDGGFVARSRFFGKAVALRVIKQILKKIDVPEILEGVGFGPGENPF